MYRGFFFSRMMKIHESGLLQIWKRRWWPKENLCALTVVTEATPIALVDVQSAFYVCLIGIFLGGFTFICEICVGRWRCTQCQR